MVKIFTLRPTGARANHAGIAGGTAPPLRSRHRPQEPERSHLTSNLFRMIARSRQNDREFRELPKLRPDIDCATVFLPDYVVAPRETKPGPAARRLGRKERIEHLFLHLGRDAGAVIANANFHATTEVFGGGTQHRLKIRIAILRLALGRSIESVRNQID